MPSPLNIAVVGVGTMAQSVHLPVIRRRWDRFSLAATVDISPRRRREGSEAWGVPEERRYETVADLVAAIRAKEVAVDAVVVATDGLHVDDVLAIMRRGIPVLLEPPLGFSAEEIARVADLERMSGRSLVMMAYPQQYDAAIAQLPEHVQRRDIRMLDYEVRMPAAQPLFGHAHVTVAAYDLPSELRAERRDALQQAVVAGTGAAANQRDRDLFVKGMLTGVAHQLAVVEGAYGPITRIEAVRQWPSGVIPGSIEVLGELEGGARVRIVWHYLPFFPEYSESLSILSARRRLLVEMPAPSFPDRRAVLSVRERDRGVVQERAIESSVGAAESMWEAFHALVVGGEPPLATSADELRRVGQLREVLATIVAADGRSLEPEVDVAPEPEAVAEPEVAAEPVVPDEPEAEPVPAPEIETEREIETAAGPVAPDEPLPDPAPEPIGEPGSEAAAAHTDALQAVASDDAWGSAAPAVPEPDERRDA